jgi:hypothetical protein
MKNTTSFIRNILAAFLLVSMLILASCSNDDPPLPDNLSTFESGELGMTEGENELTVKILLSRPTSADQHVTVSFATEGIVYGTDFTTEPEATNNTLSLTIPKGSTEGSFKLIKSAGLLLDGDEKITFNIATTTSSLIIGQQKQLSLTFAEILSSGAIIDINGGGATYANKVFVDLSANRQTAVERSTWDLGFYMLANDFKVILNSSLTMMARPLDKTNLNAVTAIDTLGFEETLLIAEPDALSWIDDPKGDLAKTAIAPISATASENKVYIVNRGAGSGTPPHRGWKKIRIVRNGSGYTLQHADINATTFQEIQISKDEAYHFKYVHFETGIVSVEPEKDKWDIAWTYFMNTTSFGVDIVPYTFQDLVLQNTYRVETAKVLTSVVSYDNFSETNLTPLIFSTSQINIGSDWRRTSPSPVIVYEDRFYIIKDGDGNYYKLRFKLILRDGVRGTPQFEYALVKKGS